MRFGGIFWWVGAFLFAGIAGVLTFSTLSRSPQAMGIVGNQATTPIVMAAVNIPFRRSIIENELVIREMPNDTVPEGAATTVEQVVGKMSTVDVFNGEPILIQQLVTPDVVTQQVALSIPEGKIVTAVPTTSELISNRLIRPGDNIDLLATFKVEVIREQGSGPMPASIGLLQNLEVHAIILPASSVTVDSEGDGSDGGVFRTTDEDGQSVLLAVDPQDALAIRHILDVGGFLDVALRAASDASVTDIKPVDQFYLADRYQIDLVRGNIQRFEQ